MTLNKKEKQIEVSVYVTGNRITLEGTDTYHKGMFALDCGVGDIHASREDEIGFAKTIVRELSGRIKPKLVDQVKISFPDSKNVNYFLDGYFGRPKLLYASERLLQIKGKRKKTLIGALNEIGKITLECGKEVPLII
ncbi:MAG: hypothetical protein ABIA78_02650 [archaeon]